MSSNFIACLPPTLPPATRASSSRRHRTRGPRRGCRSDKAMLRVAMLGGQQELAPAQAVWLVWEARDGVTYLVRERNGGRDMWTVITLRRSEVKKTIIIVYDPSGETGNAVVFRGFRSSNKDLHFLKHHKCICRHNSVNATVTRRNNCP